MVQLLGNEQSESKLRASYIKQFFILIELSLDNHFKSYKKVTKKLKNHAASNECMILFLLSLISLGCYSTLNANFVD